MATGVPDDLPPPPESAAAAAAAPMGTPGNVPVGANDGAVEALPVRRRPDRRRPEDLSCGAKGMLDGAAVVAALSGAVDGPGGKVCGRSSVLGSGTKAVAGGAEGKLRRED